MAIRRRANEVLVLSAFILLVANFYLYYRDNSDLGDEVEANFGNDSLYGYVYPPPCRKSIEESIRLNELIANAWYKCKRIKRIPDEALGYHVCVDDAVGIQHVLSGDRLTFVTLAGNSEDFRLERTLLKISTANRLLSGLILSSRTAYPILLRDYTKHVLFSSLSTEDLTDTQTLSANLAGRIDAFARNRGEGSIDILKLNCIDCWKSDHLPRLLKELISSNALESVRQLHLIIKIDQPDSKLLYLWYTTVQSLFYIRGGYFALYAAQQLGECGRTIMNCQYQLAFAKVDAAPDVGGILKIMAPVAGMGSPDEEYNRLIWYLNNPTNTDLCPEQRKNIRFAGPLENHWTVCSIGFSRETGSDPLPCLIYYFSIGDALKVVDNQWHANFPSHCSIHLFDPTLPFDQNYNAEKSSLYSLTLADESSGETQPGSLDDKVWHLSTLQTVLNQTNPKKYVISLLILDLHGGEWDIFEQLLSAASVSAFTQILMRVRIWQGEENENYRQDYTWLHRLRKIGYQPFSFRTLPDFNATSPGPPMEKCGPNWCFELGWILSP